MMNKEKMLEMMEFFEFYEAYKSMKAQNNVSARTETATIQNAPISIESGRFVQRGNEVVDLGESKKTQDVLTKFEMYELELDGKKYYCIRSGMCTGKKVKDENGNEKLKKFNISAKQLANNMIKAVDGIITFKVPFENKKGEWSAWGFKTKKKCAEALATLPKVVKAEDIEKKNAEYQANKK